MFEITIPILNEENRLVKGVTEAIAFLDDSSIDPYSLVLADNGSTDATPSLCAELAERYPGRVRLVRVPEKGVGLALQTAWGDSQADIVGYMDIDLATDLHHLEQVHALLAEGPVQIVNGTRLSPKSEVTGRTMLRAFTSRVFNALLRVRLGVSFTDGMCGFKFIRRKAYLDLQKQFPITTKGWFFCTELLVKAEWSGLHLEEIPVRWRDDADSRVKIVALSRDYLSQIARLRRERGRS